jgi:hypothetical protein
MAARYGMVFAVAMLGLIIALRMLSGPFGAPLGVRVPLNPEGWLGLALTVVLATSPDRTDNLETPRARLSGWWNGAAMAALAGFTTAAFWRSLHFYFLGDDFILVRFANSSHFDLRRLFTTPGGDGFFRPMGYVSLAFTSMWAGVNPAAWHSMSLALHVANVLLVFTLAARLGASRVAASFAAALFAIHGTRPEAAVWIAGRFDLMATFFVLAGLLFFIRSHREAASAGYLYALASLVCMVLAILSKESAYIFPVLVLLFLYVKRDLCRRSIGVLVPFFMTAAALFAYRCWLLGGIGGYRDAQTGEAQALTFGLSSVKALGLRLWMALYFPINWSVEPDAWMAALTIAYIGALVWLATSHPNRKLMAFALLFVLVSALPPLHLLAIGAGLGNSRILYLPSVGFCLMVAFAVDRLNGRILRIIPGVILAFHLAALQHNLDAWEYASAKAKSACLVAMKCAGPQAEHALLSRLPATLRGVPFFGNGLRESVELQRNGASSRAKQGGIGGQPLAVTWDEAKAEASCVAAPR